MDLLLSKSPHSGCLKNPPITVWLLAPPTFLSTIFEFYRLLTIHREWDSSEKRFVDNPYYCLNSYESEMDCNKLNNVLSDLPEDKINSLITDVDYLLQFKDVEDIKHKCFVLSGQDMFESLNFDISDINDRGSPLMSSLDKFDYEFYSPINRAWRSSAGDC